MAVSFKIPESLHAKYTAKGETVTRARLFIAIIAVIPLLAACDKLPWLSDDENRVRAIARVGAEKREARRLELTKNRATILSEIEQLIVMGKGREAVQRAAPYRQFSDPVIEDLYRRAIVQVQRESEQELLAKIRATKPSDRETLLTYYSDLKALAPENKAYEQQWQREREQELLAKIRATKPADREALLTYYSELEKLAPENKIYSQNWKRIQLEVYRLNAADRDRELAAERARRRQEGVVIGMTKAEALMSSWGKPERVNSTTTTRGTREQWVYGGRSYLYFDESGRLTTIQN